MLATSALAQLPSYLKGSPSTYMRGLAVDKDARTMTGCRLRGGRLLLVVLLQK
jgi:hypothetical protein